MAQIVRTSTGADVSVTLRKNATATFQIKWGGIPTPEGATLVSCVVTGTYSPNNLRATISMPFLQTTGSSGTTTNWKMEVPDNEGTFVEGTISAKNAGTMTFSNIVCTATFNVPDTTYTVTFKDWNGTVLKTENVPSGGNATPPVNPSRPGYTFSGWSGSYTNVTSNRDITAQYTEESSGFYSITANYDSKYGTVLYGAIVENALVVPDSYDIEFPPGSTIELEKDVSLMFKIETPAGVEVTNVSMYDDVTGDTDSYGPAYSFRIGNLFANFVITLDLEGEILDTPITGIDLDKTSSAAQLGDTVSVSASITPSNTLEKCKWQVDNSNLLLFVNNEPSMSCVYLQGIVAEVITENCTVKQNFDSFVATPIDGSQVSKVKFKLIGLYSNIEYRLNSIMSEGTTVTVRNDSDSVVYTGDYANDVAIRTSPSSIIEYSNSSSESWGATNIKLTNTEQSGLAISDKSIIIYGQETPLFLDNVNVDVSEDKTSLNITRIDASRKGFIKFNVSSLNPNEIYHIICDYSSLFAITVNGNIYGNISGMVDYDLKGHSVYTFELEIDGNKTINNISLRDSSNNTGTRVNTTSPQYDGKTATVFALVEGSYNLSCSNETGSISKNCNIIYSSAAQTHTVIFRNADGSVRHTMSVEHGGFAEYYDEPNPPDYGYVFIGWDKDITEVNSDLDVNPVFIQTDQSLIALPESITLDVGETVQAQVMGNVNTITMEAALHSITSGSDLFTVTKIMAKEARYVYEVTGSKSGSGILRVTSGSESIDIPITVNGGTSDGAITNIVLDKTTTNIATGAIDNVVATIIPNNTEESCVWEVNNSNVSIIEADLIAVYGKQIVPVLDNCTISLIDNTSFTVSPIDDEVWHRAVLPITGLDPSETYTLSASSVNAYAEKNITISPIEFITRDNSDAFNGYYNYTISGTEFVDIELFHYANSANPVWTVSDFSFTDSSGNDRMNLIGADKKKAVSIKGVLVGSSVLTCKNQSGTITKTCNITVDNINRIPISYISFIKTVSAIKLGYAYNVEAAIHPVHTNEDVIWESNNDCVSITKDESESKLGTSVVNIEALKAGITRVTCKNQDGTVFKIMEIVVGTPITDITLDKTTLTLDVNQSDTVTATITPENTTEECVWSIDNDNVSMIVDNAIDTSNTIKLYGQDISIIQSEECTVEIKDNTRFIVHPESNISLYTTVTLTIKDLDPTETYKLFMRRTTMTCWVDVYVPGGNNIAHGIASMEYSLTGYSEYTIVFTDEAYEETGATDWEIYELSFVDSNGNTEPPMMMALLEDTRAINNNIVTITGLKAGSTVLTCKNQSGTIVKTCNITINDEQTEPGITVNNLYFGANSIANLYLGENAVLKVYLGNILVYESTSGGGSSPDDPYRYVDIDFPYIKANRDVSVDYRWYETANPARGIMKAGDMAEIKSRVGGTTGAYEVYDYRLDANSPTAFQATNGYVVDEAAVTEQTVTIRTPIKWSAITTTTVNIRQYAGTDAAIVVSSLPAGTEVYILEDKRTYTANIETGTPREWYHIYIPSRNVVGYFITANVGTIIDEAAPEEDKPRPVTVDAINNRQTFHNDTLVNLTKATVSNRTPSVGASSWRSVTLTNAASGNNSAWYEYVVDGFDPNETYEIYCDISGQGTLGFFDPSVEFYTALSSVNGTETFTGYSSVMIRASVPKGGTATFSNVYFRLVKNDVPAAPDPYEYIDIAYPYIRANSPINATSSSDQTGIVNGVLNTNDESEIKSRVGGNSGGYEIYDYRLDANSSMAYQSKNAYIFDYDKITEFTKVISTPIKWTGVSNRMANVRKYPGGEAIISNMPGNTLVYILEDKKTYVANVESGTTYNWYHIYVPSYNEVGYFAASQISLIHDESADK